MEKPLRLLLIEDSEFDALMLVNQLRMAGFVPAHQRVDTADGLKTALAEQTWDLIISDYNMPQFSMVEALQLVRQSGLDVPFIIVSGGIGEDVAVAAMKAGAHDYVMKGNLARLAPAVDRELREARVRVAQRQAETALRESELRYRKLWEASTDAVILIDQSSLIHFANPAVEKIFGYKPEEIIGKNLAILQPPALRAAHREGVSHHLKAGHSPTAKPPRETIGLRQDGSEIPVEIVFTEMELHDEHWLVAFIRDISERKRAEKELRNNQEQFRVAGEIQQRLFPKTAPDLPGYDLGGASYPAEATGGDYYDYLPMVGQALGIGVGDVTGHGIGPALLMAETRAYLRVLARNRENLSDILTRANRILAEDVGSDRYVTLLLARLNPQTRTLVYASAGHPAGYIFNAAGEVKTQLKRTGIPLGIQPEARYSVGPEITLVPGDLALFLTDGIEEAMSPNNEFFGVERILEVVRAHRERPAREIVAALYQAGRQFTQGAPLLDDFTAVILKVL